MLKKIILICVCIASTMSLMAQVTVNRGGTPTAGNERKISDEREPGSSAFVMKYGFKLGVNMSSISNDMAFEPNFKMGAGIRVGALLNMRWGQRTENSLPGTGVWGFQPEIMYSLQTVKNDADDIQLSFISVPLLLKIYPSTGFSIELGPDFSYLISTSPSTIAVDGAELRVGDCKGLMVGIAAGLAYDFEKGFTIGARYTYGLNDMAKNLKWKCSNVNVALGWMF